MSSALVASSKTANRGELSSNLAKANLCCSPNESILGQSCLTSRLGYLSIKDFKFTSLRTDTKWSSLNLSTSVG